MPDPTPTRPLTLIPGTWGTEGEHRTIVFDGDVPVGYVSVDETVPSTPEDEVALRALAEKAGRLSSLRVGDYNATIRGMNEHFTQTTILTLLDRLASLRAENAALREQLVVSRG